MCLSHPHGRHGLLVVESSLDALHLDAQLVEAVLLRRDFVLEFGLGPVQVSQARLAPVHNLLLLVELLFEALDFSPQVLVPVNDFVDLREDAARLGALLLVPLCQLLQLLVLRDQLRLQVIFPLLERRALLPQVGPLLLQLRELSSQLSQPDIFLTTLAIGLRQVVIEQLLLVRCLALFTLFKNQVRLLKLGFDARHTLFAYLPD